MEYPVFILLPDGSKIEVEGTKNAKDILVDCEEPYISRHFLGINNFFLVYKGRKLDDEMSPKRFGIDKRETISLFCPTGKGLVPPLACGHCTPSH